MNAIAIVGMACRYAETRSPGQLWENVLAQRRSFRRLPRVRLNLADYSGEFQSQDRITVQMAAVLDDYGFDRSRFHISQEAFAATDLTHWLALDVAAQALADARLLTANVKQRERTSVYMGNSLAGEFSRANLLRLRWPYVRRVLVAALRDEAHRFSDLETLIAGIETLYKAPFPATNEESLAGGLSNTIAGRICNYFDFKGGGYIVDGACASSLLAVATGCSALQSGDADVALAGGVDLSLDPFELAGFSSLGALAGDSMRVFDAQSSGFLPGEGCGAVVLMRHEDALANHLPPYALIQGWGISSDGQGGITRPEISGQVLALRRAYHKAGYGIDSVNYFEGHGTGTSIGDATELQALSCALREAGTGNHPVAIGSVKANIGHTKAAAGVAGLIKAVMAVHSKTLPPTTGCDRPHPELTTGSPELRVLAKGELWPDGISARAGVSAFGFGGINVHVTLEAAGTLARKSFTSMEEAQIASVQDCELFLFTAPDAAGLSAQLEEILLFAGEASYAELTDLSIFLAKKVHATTPRTMVRAACVASSPDELVAAIRNLLAWCETGTATQIDVSGGTFVGSFARVPCIGFLFPGQASPVYTGGGSWVRRFPSLRTLYAQAGLPEEQSADTSTAQPCIVAASLAGLQVLSLFGVEGSIAVGHSLGELTALCWAGACTEEELLRLVHARGRAMADEGDPSGAMISIRAGHDEVLQRLNGDDLVVAAHNAPLQTVVAGEARSISAFGQRLRSHGLSATMLPVSHAFHSPLVARAATAFSGFLSRQSFSVLSRRVISTVTAAPLAPAADLKTLLTEQITRPVLFAEALDLASTEADMFIEVGSGAVLTGIAEECTDKPVLALDAGGKSLRGLCSAVGAAFALGADVRTSQLFEERFGRAIDPGKRHSFLASPCETVPESILPARPVAIPVMGQPLDAEAANSAVNTLLALVARRTELPAAAIKTEHRFLTDLHLNSITISQLMLEAATRLSLPAPVAPGEFTNASIAEAAAVLDGLRSQSHNRIVEKHPRGVDVWTRVLGVEQVEKPLRRAALRSRGNWEITAAEESPLQNHLREKFRTVSGAGLLCCVPGERHERSAAFLLCSTQAALQRGLKQITFLQQAGGASALARTLYLENPDIRVTVVNAPLDHPDVTEWAAAEASANSSFVEACYDPAGVRREPRLKLACPESDADWGPLGHDDVLMVTGGGKGIAAESALHLARLTGCRLALLGRSDPLVDLELKRNLDRIGADGICFAYFTVDITDASAVNLSVQRIVEKFGPITAILHGAGVNRPKKLQELTIADMEQTLAPKLTGLRCLLDAVDPAGLRLLLTFGSIIARTGLHGEAHYGLANEWLNLMVENLQKKHAQCRCLNLEWSVWAGLGMGQNLGVLDSLVRQGITPLPVNEAMAHLQSLLTWKQAPASVIVTGRFGSLPTLRFDSRELPLLRFLEHPRIYHPGIELIADAELSAESDPYVTEHVFQNEQLFPAVMGMEAMAQAAQTLEQSELLPFLRNLRFEHPIVVPHGGRVTVRVAALRRRPGLVAVVIRCSATDFQIEHFSGECVFEPNQSLAGKSAVEVATHVMSMDSARDLYGHIFFQSGRFRRVGAYEVLHSDRCLARLGAPAATSWFAHHLPPALVLGDAASRDAALHSVQASIPHKTILPVSIDRIMPATDWTGGTARVLATERASDGDNFVYDLRIEDAEGRLCEVWDGLHLRAVAAIEITTPWPPGLFAPYIERRVRQILADEEARVRLATTQGQDRLMSGDLIRKMFGPDAMVTHRPDGRPEIAGLAGPQPCVSFSHARGATLLFAAKRLVGCDLQEVSHRDRMVWEQLLEPEGSALARQLAEKSRCAFDNAATQVWALKESLRKAGCGYSPPICLSAISSDGWAGFSSGGFKGVTYCTQITGVESTFAFGFVINNTP